MTGQDYLITLHREPAGLDRAEWNSLLAAQAHPTPFMTHEFLQALHESGSACQDSGWSPCFLTLHGGSPSRLQAACALYLKSHSYGEYVFDWAWADAYRRHGLSYYPKLLGAVPFTPVPGARLLAQDEPSRQALVRAIRLLAQKQGLSSAHLLFTPQQELAALEEDGWMIRHGVQFHWHNPPEAPWPDFDHFLESLQREKRKKIRQERRRVEEAGVRFTVHRGPQISSELWDLFYSCYTLTYRLHHSTPYLTRAFFSLMAQRMPQNWLMFVAHQGNEAIASSLIAIDDDLRVAYGRYWGALRHIPCLHFEACYYQPLAWCIEQGYRRFEGGAQGEHKMARGLLPVATASAHWLADERFASAVNDFLQREGDHVAAYVDELNERNPFK